ncbi:ribokinase [Clostridium sp. AL.422]|uniref:ribokinase n=1 Tax=Clostridium TaxID=1485 RepID=UPI00293DF279|nr:MULTISPECIES: ribokinase [unclassified Clostridium]MDV4150187.1 ribokinase [Clostridium sp. AL.422]
MKRIVVVGSINMDLVIEADRIPKIGETLKGEKISYLIGGKGANQAVAACRLGNEVSLISCVGKDDFGDKSLKILEAEGIDVHGIRYSEESFTGIASIFKTNKDNSIIVIPGANDLCTKEIVDENIERIKEADVLITQLEIPIETVEYALKIAKENGVKTILNPAPAIEINKEILKSVDLITPNETEFEIISGRNFNNANDLEDAMLLWQNENPSTRLIVTRGEDGSSYVDKGKVKTINAIDVNVIDTTGAGDTFNGGLAHGISHDLKIEESIIFAVTAASLSVTKLGAQTGMPKVTEVNNALNIK